MRRFAIAFLVGWLTKYCLPLLMHEKWLKSTDRPGDPPLSPLGHEQAREAGLYLDQLLSEQGLTADDITWLSSPFLRCIQTSNDAIQAMTQVTENASKSSTISILPGMCCLC